MLHGFWCLCHVEIGINDSTPCAQYCIHMDEMTRMRGYLYGGRGNLAPIYCFGNSNENKYFPGLCAIYWASSPHGLATFLAWFLLLVTIAPLHMGWFILYCSNYGRKTWSFNYQNVADKSKTVTYQKFSSSMSIPASTIGQRGEVPIWGMHTSQKLSGSI